MYGPIPSAARVVIQPCSARVAYAVEGTVWGQGDRVKSGSEPHLGLGGGTLELGIAHVVQYVARGIYYYIQARYGLAC